MNLALHEFSRGHGIDSVCQVERVDDGKVSADEIVFEAKGFHLACVDVWQRLAVKGVTEEDLRVSLAKRDRRRFRDEFITDHCGYLGSDCSREPLHSEVDHLSSLTDLLLAYAGYGTCQPKFTYL